MRAKRILTFIAAVAFMIACGEALAWGGTGHKIVAQIAEDQLNPRARAQVQALLADEADPTLAGIANWADEIRQSDRSWAHYHFVNFPRGDCHYDKKVECPDGMCAVEGIKRFGAELGNPATPRDERIIALKMLVHLVGDVHQPLHAGYSDDKGGNTVQIQWDGRGTNLHALWDTLMIHDTGLSYQNYARRLESMQTSAAGTTPEQWAEESCSIVSRDGFYPDSRSPGPEYMARWQPVTDGRLLAAGRRLGALLNAYLGG